MRRINLGNYEHYEIECEDEFDDWDKGFKIIYDRILQAERLLSPTGRRHPITVHKIRKEG